MALPQIETLPDFVLQAGRKNLSSDVIESIKKLISRLYLVDVEDKADALNNIGVLESYINNFSKSVEAFKQSLSFDFSDGVYSNYLQALEKSGEYKLAISEAIGFLENNPNNQKIFHLALSISQKYFFENDFNKILDFNIYQPYSVESTNRINSIKEKFKFNLDKLIELDIDSEYLSLLINLAFVEVKKIQSGLINIEIQFTDIEYMSIKYIVHGSDFYDIKLLNRTFDDQISSLVESESISSSLYFDHLSKLAIGFVIGNENLKAA